MSLVCKDKIEGHYTHVVELHPGRKGEEWQEHDLILESDGTEDQGSVPPSGL